MDIWRDGAEPVADVALTGSFDLQGVLSLTGRKSPQSRRDIFRRDIPYSSGRTAVDPTYNSCETGIVVQSAV
jgi:hypothetical protein